MKLYLAARYSRKQEIADVAARLRAEGFTVTSTWFEELHGGQVQLVDLNPHELRRYALRDLEELSAAHVLLFFSESDQAFNRRGGRHVEFGFALALAMPIAVVGPIENIFHYVPAVHHYPSIEAFMGDEQVRLVNQILGEK